ncbi:UvrB/UvrC motif-containing protein [Evansella cellulosilytica]|uniref:UvrB/UvrC protein n=1 Tax=Evansella cellulosilytica (strain ATCC 21833 / DSM 2522 / FERM P-1141 / JCM 9156 / N-4) TaxID=649639 RepID=E6TSG1_EVAC2|nr:UvrB/UvrC motif-containing protein [Evansella cellulosilytica]ADU28376.1 UvrB/UvrC protein [Evansella cellulosilytica DSM 2522]
MLCQECQQRQATLHFTKIINGEKTEFHICDTCAKEKGDYFPGSNSFSIHQLLSGLLDVEKPLSTTSGTQITPKKELKCEKCGMTYQQFADIGRFGCSACYDTFNEKLDPILRRIHSGNSVHGGKIPRRKGKDLHVHKEIERLKQDMQKYINEEEFESAAEVRDQIRSLEKSLQDEKEG